MTPRSENRRIRSRLARAVTVALASLTLLGSLAATPDAHARPRKPGTQQKSCWWNGKEYSHGAVKKVRRPRGDGTYYYYEYTCDNGEWKVSYNPWTGSSTNA